MTELLIVTSPTGIYKQMVLYLKGQNFVIIAININPGKVACSRLPVVRDE